ncbi:NAD-dependent DNA ligase [Acidithiobacillus ferrooxidans]|jgi:DNA ligase (NAD+)|uniref:BRCT domain-containing protein n=1 Tax=Acidithiobacillus ferrooxidans TaxID=920 RepID=UPI002149479C|nr:BRCT domain-containing protein [Acidithiobacillus ferrooxidans]MCR1345277.1 NAD-dependent DNA ligase [Acidithiobacillus ferrooxidans]MCR1354437.1 NAD-dependent DNA ligase [Acidithiobacillus ferrooxidans]
MSLVHKLEEANAAYRAGDPIMSDAEYDALVEKLRTEHPEHPFLNAVEPEPTEFFGGTKVRHHAPMLSTEKAYTEKDLIRFFGLVERQAALLGIQGLMYAMTVKLDGLAGSRDRARGVELATRGNGLQGEDISSAFARGLKIVGADVDGPGEIVMPQAFFESEMVPLGLKNPRNVMVGFVAAETEKEHHRLIAEAGMAHFMPYQNLPKYYADRDTILRDIQTISESMRKESPYKTDGIVIEIEEPELRAALGSTNHYHRWQIAYKTKGETAETTVTGVVWQTGRTGRITPVIEIEPVELSGATIRRATAHNFQKARKDGLGVGSRVTMIRSGEVIPFIMDVLSPAPLAVPTACPCCGGPVEEEGEYLTCVNPHCEAQAEGAISHFFKIMGTADGFGPKAVEKLVAAGITDILAVLNMTRADFEGMGFGPGQAENLEREMERCMSTPVEDWRFLAAFGIRYLGRGDSKALLGAVGGLDALNGITHEQIMAVNGFAEKTALCIAYDLTWRWMEIDAVRNRMQVPLISSVAAGAVEPLPFSGMNLVFTGTFSKDREALETQAEALGAKVQSSVNGKTSVLVTGEKPGASKTTKAAALGTPVWTEAEYLFRIKG